MTLTDAEVRAIAAEQAQRWQGTLAILRDCTCVMSCADHPATACSLSGIEHVHPDDGTGVFGPCPVHPDAPGDH